MEATDRSSIESEGELQKISKLFGSYKAEWLSDTLFDLYSEPSYFPELLTSRPCVLTGGRGTGKTTVLKSLSYDGQWEILKRQIGESAAKKFAAMPYYGFYYKVNTTRVTAFAGPLLQVEEWQRIFLHYMTVVFANKAITFLDWYSNAVADPELHEEFYEELCALLSIDRSVTLQSIKRKLNNSLISIESYINNIGIDERPRLSSQGALENLLNLLGSVKIFQNKTFFILIDEYENFRDEQQQVINTLVKHTNSTFTFKIGVKKLGWRVRYTLNPNEHLISPSDYVLIDIANKLAENDFSAFAQKICNSRIEKLFTNAEIKPTVKDLFPYLSMEEEASRLGVGEAVFELREEIAQSDDNNLKLFIDELSDLDLYILQECAVSKGIAPTELLHEAMNDLPTWKARIQELDYSYLFSLRANKQGLRKYYAGWDTLVKLSCINIRYLLELVEQSLLLHYRKNQSFEGKVAPELQTQAAQYVGRKNLQELEGLSVYGAKLTKLVLGLGRVFGTLAERPAGHASEVNQFRIRTSDTKVDYDSDEWLLNERSPASQILNAAVMHLALVTFPGNKPKTEGDTRENTFLLHPIFAPYFIFSHRKRRNLVITEEQVLGLIETPNITIREILKENNRIISEKLPEQLLLFETFYSK